MVPQRLRERGKALGRQRGLTLIELVAVMAILAILVAIVAPATTNTQTASIRAQAQGDSQQVLNAANDFFADQEASEVRIPHSITTSADMATATSTPTQDDLADVDTSISTTVVTDAGQEVSTKWPEMYLTEGADPPSLTSTLDAKGNGRSENSKYGEVFQTPTTNTLITSVDKLILLDKDGALLAGKAFVEDHTAIDVQLLLDGGYLASPPEAEDRTSDGGGTLELPNFLWVFEKTNSSGGTDDARNVKVFQLVEIAQDEGLDKVDLTYRQIL